MSITSIDPRFPSDAKDLIRLALTRGQKVSGGRTTLGRTNRDAISILIQGGVGDFMTSWSFDRKTSEWVLSYAVSWDSATKTWPIMHLADIRSLLEAADIVQADVVEMSLTQVAAPARPRLTVAGRAAVTVSPVQQYL